MSVRTRFAPSPTGYLHIGGARTALFNWLYARHCGGSFILRIEDTDRERSTPESVQAILDGMSWMGLDWDEGPIYQTARFERYRAVTSQLLNTGHAYHCYCTRETLDQVREAQRAEGIKPRYNRHCRDLPNPERPGIEPVVRFKNPLDGAVVFDDAIRGRVLISNDELDDLVIARSDGSPTYNFSVVVDDIDMSITHVIRGDDHVNNTPRQINIYTTLGVKPPVFSHVPMITGADGQRLSKRHGAVSVLQYRDDGFLPEAMLNYLVRLGWSHGDQEIFSPDEMIGAFDIDDVNRAASAFDLDKLKWLNQHYIKLADSERLVKLLVDCLKRRGIDIDNGPDPEAVVDALKERAQTLEEMADKSEYFYQEFEDYDAGAARKHLRPVARSMLEDVRGRLDAMTGWTAEGIHQQVNDTVMDAGAKLGKLAQPLRVAVSGTAATPPIDQTLLLVGRERTLARIDRALDFINRRAESNA